MSALRVALLSVMLPALALAAPAHGPDCSRGWPTGMAQTVLKNERLLRNEEIDFARSKTVRLASERRARDLWHQVYLVTFAKKSGGSVQAIVVHDASMEECSMTQPQIYVISRELDAR